MQSTTKKKRLSIQSIDSNYTDEEIDKNIKNVTLDPPKTAFDFYIEEKVGKTMKTQKKIKSKSSSASKKKTANTEYYNQQFNYLSNQDREKYKVLEKEDLERYKKELLIVEKYLIRSYHKRGATAEQLFIKDFIKSHMEKNETKCSEIEAKAIEQWNKMSYEQKNEWYKLKEENDKWWKKAQHYDQLSVFDYFCMKKMEQAEEKDIELLVSDCEYLWKRLSDKKMEQYVQETKEENERRKEYKEIIELDNKMNPQKNSSAYNIFVKTIASTIDEKKEEDSKDNKTNLSEEKKEEKAEEKKEEKGEENKGEKKKEKKEEKNKKESKVKPKKYNFFKHVSELWTNMSNEDKQRYVNLAHREELIYRYRKKLYEDNIEEQKKKINEQMKNDTNKITGKEIFIKEHQFDTIPSGKIPKDYYDMLWEELDVEEQKEYVKQADEQNAKNISSNQDKRLFTTPKKKPKTAYQVFFKEKMIQLNKPEEASMKKEVTVLLSGEWKGMGNSSKKKYLDNYVPSSSINKSNNKENKEIKKEDLSKDKKKVTPFKVIKKNK